MGRLRLVVEDELVVMEAWALLTNVVVVYHTVRFAAESQIILY